MKFFIDSADIDIIKPLLALNLVDGVTTNPSLIAKTGKKFPDIIAEIAHYVKGSVSAEVTSEDYTIMIKQAEKLCALAENICIKLPLTFDGLRACRYLAEKGKQTNLTLCFSATQAILAAKAGATYVSPFIGRLDDTGIDGLTAIKEIRTIFDNYNFPTKILAASIRTLNHVKQAAIIGADVATLPPTLLKSLIAHPLTEIGLEIFREDIKNSLQKDF